MAFSLKKYIKIITFWLLVLVGCLLPIANQTNGYSSNLPSYEEDFVEDLIDGGRVLNPANMWNDGVWVSPEKLLRQNITTLFYPSEYGSNTLYKVIRDMTLWAMIAFFVWAWASILFNRKPEEVKKTLWSLVYILVWWLFIYWANRIFGSVLDFNASDFTADSEVSGIWGVVKSTKGIFFVVLSALKAFAFFLAIIMIVITWFRVIAAWEWDKGKKLVKWLINVIIALMIIKWIDFVYYVVKDTPTAIQNMANFIINIAKVFAYIYWVIIVIMVIIAWYLYMTDGWSWSNFKRASNVLVNILLSALVLFAFLLILYQIFAEFQAWWDAVAAQSFIMEAKNIV